MKMPSGKGMCIWRWAFILGLVLGGLFCDSPVALAHRVNMFAWVEGDTIYVESKYPGGRKVKNGHVMVLDLEGRKLLEGRTDDQGEFSFKIPQRTDLKIVLNAGMGHRAEWTIDAEELLGQEDAEAPTKPAATSQHEPTDPEGSSRGSEQAQIFPGLDALEIQKLVEQSLDEKLAPILKVLEENRDRGATVTEVIGGIGYIFGLIGVAAYISSRRKRS